MINIYRSPSDTYDSDKKNKSNFVISLKLESGIRIEKDISAEDLIKFHQDIAAVLYTENKIKEKTDERNI